MKSPTTIRRELRRLRGMRSRDDVSSEQRALLMRDILTLQWVVGGYELRPSDRHPGLKCRKGEP